MTAAHPSSTHYCRGAKHQTKSHLIQSDKRPLIGGGDINPNWMPLTYFLNHHPYRLLTQLQSSAKTAEQVLARMDRATPRELNKTLRTLQSQLNGIQRGTPRGMRR